MKKRYHYDRWGRKTGHSSDRDEPSVWAYSYGSLILLIIILALLNSGWSVPVLIFLMLGIFGATRRR